MADVGRVQSDVTEAEQCGSRHEKSEGHHWLGAESRQQDAIGYLRDGNEDDNEREKSDPTLYRAESQRALKVVRQEQEHAEDPDGGEERHQQRSAPRPVEHDPRWEQRVFRSSLNEREYGKQDHPSKEESNRVVVAPC